MVKCPFAAKGCNYPEGDCPGHCLVDNGLRQHRPEARRLAKVLEANPLHSQAADLEAAAELRRLHAENEDFLVTCEHLTRENAEQIREIVALKEQRDELLAALEKIATSVEIDTLRSAIECARAAIAKATT